MAEKTWAGQELRAAAKSIAEGVRVVLDKAAADTMEDFYKDYSPEYYERTGNLKQAYRSRVNVDAYGRPNEGTPIPKGTLVATASVTFSPAYMKPYSHNTNKLIDTGLAFKDGLSSFASTLNEETREFFGLTFSEVDPEIIFNLDFIEGYHGGRYWQKTRNWVATRGKKQKAGNYWQKANKSTSPYELMEKRYESITKEGGTVDRYLKSKYDSIREKIDTAIMKDIAAEFSETETEV